MCLFLSLFEISLEESLENSFMEEPLDKNTLWYQGWLKLIERYGFTTVAAVVLGIAFWIMIQQNRGDQEKMRKEFLSIIDKQSEAINKTLVTISERLNELIIGQRHIDESIDEARFAFIYSRANAQERRVMIEEHQKQQKVKEEAAKEPLPKESMVKPKPGKESMVNYTKVPTPHIPLPLIPLTRDTEAAH
jgi:hypothetical protein